MQSLGAALADGEDQRVLFRLGGTLFGKEQYRLARHAYVAALQVGIFSVILFCPLK